MRLKSAEAIPKAIWMNVAKVTVPIRQSVTASQRKLYLIPVTAGGTPGIMPGATIITSVRSPLRLRHVMRATPDSKMYADSEECCSSKMMPRFLTRLIFSAAASLFSWRDVSQEMFLRPRSPRIPDT
jgi:hypothetical protein